MKLLTKNGLLAFFFSSEEEKKYLREWQSDCMYTKLCAFSEETEEIRLVAGLITFLFLDTCEIPKHHVGFMYL